MYLLILSSLMTVINQGCKMKTSNDNYSSIDSLFQDYQEDYLKLYPLTATWIGDSRYNDTLPNDISESYRKNLKDFYSKYKNELLKCDRETLDYDRKLSYDIWTNGRRKGDSTF